MDEEIFEMLRKRKRRKRCLAFILAVAMLITFAIPIGMMIPVSEPENTSRTKKDSNAPPLYSASISLAEDAE